MILIVTRPEYEVTTRHVSSWAEEVINFAKTKGVDIIDLFKKKANRVEFEGRLNKLGPRLVFLNGHGSDDSVEGQDSELIVKAGENHQILHKRITYALSCSSAKVLGRLVAQDSASTYIGYVDDFIFTIGAANTTRPLDDHRSRPFRDASNQVMISLLKGRKAKEASERSKEVFKKNYLKLLSSGSDPDSLQDAQLLWWNMNNQVCLGNQEASI